ncbi:MAG: transposase [Gemmataceae bacterium]|nr:transposase [Gemmataceae bacterium]
MLCRSPRGLSPPRGPRARPTSRTVARAARPARSRSRRLTSAVRTRARRASRRPGSVARPRPTHSSGPTSPNTSPWNSTHRSVSRPSSRSAPSGRLPRPPPDPRRLVGYRLWASNRTRCGLHPRRAASRRRVWRAVQSRTARTRDTFVQSAPVKVHDLPKYAPDTNPIERVWWRLHEAVTRNHRCRTMDELLDLTFDWFETHTHFRVQSSAYDENPGKACDFRPLAGGNRARTRWPVYPIEVGPARRRSVPNRTCRHSVPVGDSPPNRSTGKAASSSCPADLRRYWFRTLG